MKKILSLLLFLSFNYANAQLTFGLAYTTSEYKVNAADVFMDNFSDGFEFSLGYIQRLKAKRVDFHPSISILTNKQGVGLFFVSNTSQSIGNVSENRFHLNINFRVFPLDVNGLNKAEKDGNLFNSFKKSLFVFGGASLVQFYQYYRFNSINSPFLTSDKRKYFNQDIRVGLGMGFEFSLNERLGLSATIAGFRFRKYPRKYLIDLDQECFSFCIFPPEDFSDGKYDDVIQAQAGFAVHYKFRQNNYRSIK